MDLTLNVLRCPDSAMPEPRRVPEGTFRIGRGADCDWVLTDPDRVLSKHHCVLEFRDGGWLVRDTSVNGTFHNGAGTPLGRDTAAPLLDGDRIRLGAYEIEVRLQQGAAASPPPLPGLGGAAPEWGQPQSAPPPSWGAPLPAAPSWGADPAWSGQPQRAQPIQPRLPGDAFPIGGGDAAPVPGSMAADPRFSDEGPAMPDHVSPVNAAFYMPEPLAPHLQNWDRPQPAPGSAAPPVPQPPQGWSLASGGAGGAVARPEAFAPPGRAAEPHPFANAANPLPGLSAPAAPEPSFPPRGAGEVRQPPPQPGPSQGMPLPGMEPAPQPAPMAPLPGFDAVPQTPSPAPLPGFDGRPGAPASLPPAGFDAVPGIAPRSPQPAFGSPAPLPPAGLLPGLGSAPPPDHGPAPGANPFENEPSLRAPGLAPIAPPVLVDVPPPAVPLAPVEPAAPLPAGSGEAALAALLAGMGLAPTPALMADPNATLRAAGAALRAAIAGLRGLLIARAEVKRDFRIEATMLGVANNPVKFSHNDEAALQALLGAPAIGPRAVQETVADLTAHQVATMAATQAAARALLDRLAPTGIEAADPGGSLFGAGRDKRLWEAYKRQHQQVTSQFEDDFDSAFGKAFARAYEQAQRGGRG